MVAIGGPGGGAKHFGVGLVTQDFHDSSSYSGLIVVGHHAVHQDGMEAGMLRLHPAFEWSADFLIYFMEELGLFVLPTTDSTIGGAWSINSKVA